MRESIVADIAHSCQVDSGKIPKNFWRKLRVIHNSYGLQVIIAHRFCRWSGLGRSGVAAVVAYPVKFFALIFKRITELMYDIRIDSAADIGLGLYIGHFGGIRIGYSSIGEWCNINHQVQIGCMKSNEPPQKVVIGNYVWIGAHSRINPGVVIGDGATISAGTVVSRDVPPGALIAGPACRILNMNYENTHLLGLPDHVKCRRKCRTVNWP